MGDFQATFNSNGYPAEETLDRIEKWDVLKEGVDGLLQLVIDAWHWNEYIKLTGKNVRKLEFHTGGWSGNEDIIHALEKNLMFFTLFWAKSVRGGHYYFKIPAMWKEKTEVKKMVEATQITAKGLQEKYEKDMDDLQRTCKHDEVSDWLIVREFHGNDTGVKVKQCEICWKKLEYKTACEACGKEYTYVKRDWTVGNLCPECLKKGKYYCPEHKLLYNNREGCPTCIKLFEKADLHNKKPRGKKHE